MCAANRRARQYEVGRIRISAPARADINPTDRRATALRVELLGEHLRAVDVLERDAQHLAVLVDVDLAEELVAAAGRRVRDRRGLLEDHLRAEGLVQRVRAEAAGVQRAGDEFPEGREVLELRALFGS